MRDWEEHTEFFNIVSCTWSVMEMAELWRESLPMCAIDLKEANEA